MSVSRETIMTALLAHLSSVAAFKTKSRRLRKPESFRLDEVPALMLLEAAEMHRSPSTRQPPIRRMMAQAVLYTDVGTDANAIPAATINNILDAIEAALAPDNPLTGQFTLGGKVESIVVDGRVVKAPGDLTGKSLAIVPLSILMP